MKFKTFNHAYHVLVQIIVYRGKGVGIGYAFAIGGGTEEMAGAVGDKKLHGRCGVALQIEQNAVHMRRRVLKTAFGNGAGMGCVAVHKLDGIVRQFAKIAAHRLVGTMDRCAECRITDIQPVTPSVFTCHRLHLRIARDIETIRVVGERECPVTGIGHGETHISVRLWDGIAAASRQSEKPPTDEGCRAHEIYYFVSVLHHTPLKRGAKIRFFF